MIAPRKDFEVTTYYGTLGNDRIIGSSSPDILYGYPEGGFPDEEFGDDYLRGGAGNDDIYGGGGNDTLLGDQGGDDLYGGDGNDILYGGEGNDHFDGGAGNDLFVIEDDLMDTFLGGLGTDRIRLDDFVSYQRLTLDREASVETLDLNGFTLSGTQYGDDFDFSGLTSIRYGGTIIDLGDGNDDYLGHAGADYVNGGGRNDVIRTSSGNDTLDGGSGADTLEGGAGNDIYVVDNASDKVIELSGAGSDLVRASISHTLATNIEALTLIGAGNIGGSGNALANTMLGNSGHNVLNGGAGNDILKGGAGNDRLIGGLGRDSLYGGAGNDTYYVDTTADKVIETSSAGSDLVHAAVGYTLTANVESLTLLGTGNIGGTGNGLANVITGNSGNNALNGAAGNDILRGGTGADRLTGGLGNDTFIFQTLKDSTVAGTGRDTIYDFARGDRIDLRAIDAKAGTAANDAFTFIGSGDFSRRAGELRFEKAASDLYVQGDVNGDGKADFSIHVDDLGSLGKEAFFL